MSIERVKGRPGSKDRSPGSLRYRQHRYSTHSHKTRLNWAPSKLCGPPASWNSVWSVTDEHPRPSGAWTGHPQGLWAMRRPGRPPIRGRGRPRYMTHEPSLRVLAIYPASMETTGAGNLRGFPVQSRSVRLSGGTTDSATLGLCQRLDVLRRTPPCALRPWGQESVLIAKICSAVHHDRPTTC